MNYAQCAAFHARRKDKTNHWRRFSHNQWIGYDQSDGAYLHKHHNTVTVMIYPDDMYKLYTGGWDTVTTWLKIREFVNLPWIKPPPKAIEKRFLKTEDGKRTPFYEGIRVTSGGVVVSEPTSWMERHLLDRVPGRFNCMAKDVRAKLPKFQLQNFDMQMVLHFGTTERVFLIEKEMLDLMWYIHSTGEVHDRQLAALYTPRPRCVFGKVRSCYQISPAPEQTPRQLLNVSINAARRAFYADSSNSITVEVRDNP